MSNGTWAPRKRWKYNVSWLRLCLRDHFIVVSTHAEVQVMVGHKTAGSRAGDKSPCRKSGRLGEKVGREFYPQTLRYVYMWCGLLDIMASRPE